MDTCDQPGHQHPHRGRNSSTLCPATATIKNANSICLIGKPLDIDLAQATGRDVRLENDANCFVVSEATDGAGAKDAVIFGAILGTGVGGGISIDGKQIRGLNAIAGEWGHHKIIADGPLCYCGGRGCVESLLSGPALAEAYRAATGKIADAEGILEALRDGDSAAQKSQAYAGQPVAEPKGGDRQDKDNRRPEHRYGLGRRYHPVDPAA